MYATHGKSGTDRLYSAVRAVQEETAKKKLERAQHLVHPDIEAAWQVIGRGDATISRSELIERLSNYIPHADQSSANHLAGGGGSMTFDKLEKLLWADGKPQLPIKMSDEAWQLLDPHGRGTIGLDTLLRMLSTIPGCEKLDPDDLRVIRLLLDLAPEDFAVAEQNWAQMGTWALQLEELTAAQRKLLAARAASQAAAAAPGARGGAGAAVGASADRRTPGPWDRGGDR